MQVIVTTREDLDAVISESFQAILSKFTANISVPSSIEIIDGVELRKRLGITETTLIRYKKKGQIPYLKVGSSLRYNWFAVVQALEMKKSKR